MQIEAPGKKIQPAPDQPPLIPPAPAETPASEPSDDDTLRRIVHENQEELRKQREEEAQKPDYTDI